MSELPKEVIERISKDVNEVYQYGKWERRKAYVIGAIVEATRSAALLEEKDEEIERLKTALDQINMATRLPGETDDKYLFNRCWHIANEATQPYRDKIKNQ